MSHSLEWRCPECQRPDQQELDGKRSLSCSNCQHAVAYVEGALDDSGQVVDPATRCVCCGYDRLFAQKDFNR
ncbi:MAG TPA: hypothetical protein QGG47_12700, partial [Acidobacteriota bacterium]|nr:hypothetical protein [Acidobacteriota bacterium]